MSVLTYTHEELATPCRSHDPELWFSEQTDHIAAAQQLCRSCPLVAACLAGALERREPWGVWGGELFERGAVVARKRPKGRPRKDDPEVARRAAADLAERLAALEADFASDPVDRRGHVLVGLLPVPREGGAAA